MTDDMLRLARQAIPSVPWQFDDMHAIVYDPRDGTQFDPANNAEQCFDVIAWMYQNDHDCFCGDNPRRDWTASGIRAAVVEAARRVVK